MAEACESGFFFIKVCYNSQKEFIRVNDSSMNTFLDACKLVFIDVRKKCYDLFLSGWSVFEINSDETVVVELFDHQHFKIDPEFFNEIVNQFKNCSDFYVRLSVRIKDSDEPNIDAIVSSTPFSQVFCFEDIFDFFHFPIQGLESFMKSQNAGPIFENYEATQIINESERRKIIGLVHDYLRSKCRVIKENHLIAASKALLVLFPCLTEITCDPEKKFNGGIVCINRVCIHAISLSANCISGSDIQFTRWWILREANSKFEWWKSFGQ